MAHPYLCPAGKPTIGYGATHYPDGTAVHITDPAISENSATMMLDAMLADYGAKVDGLLTVDVTQGQFDALTDFAYNCGVANLRSSTLLKYVNEENFDAAAREFGKWDHAGGKVLPGLTARRKAEKHLFLGT